MALRRAVPLVLVLIAAAIAWSPAAAVAAPPREAPVLEVFTRAGCSHCARAGVYLDELQARRPEVRVIVSDVGADPAARARLRELAERHGALLAVPAFVVGDRMLVGFDAADTTGRTIERWLDEQRGALDTVDLPGFGEVRVRDLGLPAFSIVLGLVDGFNPCAMWVLLFLLSLLVHLRSRRRMALIGGTFVVVSGVVYYLFMTAWLGMFLVLGVSRWLEAALGLIAFVIGAIHVKDFIAPHHGPSLSIPARAKPKLYARMRRIVYAENVTGALAMTATLAAVVNLVELLCTAGLPALFTQILAAHGLSWWEHHAYMALYVLAYMLDDAAMLTIAVITLSHRKVQERAGRVLKLVSGAVMIALGALLLARPDWLRFG
ncbi:MAG TPA: glutaredoxin family protein [Kofleriaceae bacterium]|nr:glutaredoxin family protein [Kofleriaceae bacterium]